MIQAEQVAPERIIQILDFVRLGYGDLHDKPARSLQFRTEELSTDDMKLVLALVPRYNGFDGAKIALGIECLRGEISHYEFGREGSPVIYVTLPYWTQQQENWGLETPDDRRRLTAQEHEGLVARVKQLLESMGADEIDPGSSDHELRAWWD